jgi:hypothetical protein
MNGPKSAPGDRAGRLECVCGGDWFLTPMRLITQLPQAAEPNVHSNTDRPVVVCADPQCRAWWIWIDSEGWARYRKPH